MICLETSSGLSFIDVSTSERCSRSYCERVAPQACKHQVQPRVEDFGFGPDACTRKRSASTGISASLDIRITAGVAFQIPANLSIQKAFHTSCTDGQLEKQTAGQMNYWTNR